MFLKSKEDQEEMFYDYIIQPFQSCDRILIETAIWREQGPF